MSRLPTATIVITFTQNAGLACNASLVGDKRNTLEERFETEDEVFPYKAGNQSTANT